MRLRVPPLRAYTGRTDRHRQRPRHVRPPD
nr:MAG TPA: hypothetical protein [Caudoviricetes sp.]